MTATPLDRLGERARAWRVKIEDVLDTETSVIAFGTRDVTASENQSVVLKVIKQPGDEWCSGDVLAAFNGHGVARVYEHGGHAIEASEIKLEDLSRHYDDEAERWLYVRLNGT